MSTNLLAGSNGVLDSLANGNVDPIVDDTLEVDINIKNVVCIFSTRCHLNLRKIATVGSNVQFRRDQGLVSMKIRNPMITASIRSSGKITCIGASSEEEAKKAARRVARILQKLDFNVKFTSFRVVNVLATVKFPFGIKISQFTEENREVCSYEPEINSGATYRFKEASAVLKIFHTGSITLTAPSIRNIRTAVEHIYALVYNHRKEEPSPATLARKRPWHDTHNSYNGYAYGQYRSEINGKRRRPFDDETEEI